MSLLPRCSRVGSWAYPLGCDWTREVSLRHLEKRIETFLVQTRNTETEGMHIKIEIPSVWE